MKKIKDMKKSKGIKVDFNVKEGEIEVLGNEIEKEIFSKISNFERGIKELVKKLNAKSITFEGVVNLNFLDATSFCNFALKEAKHFSNVSYVEKDGMTEEKIKIKLEEAKSDFFDKTKSKEIDDWRSLWLDIDNIMKLERTLESYKEVKKCYFKSCEEAWGKVELYKKYDEKFRVHFHYSKEKLQAMADVIENDFAPIVEDLIRNENFSLIYNVSRIVIENGQGEKRALEREEILESEELVKALRSCYKLRI